jgi:GrpB-like predicted nucleotidyltransferase (UPF0157 family)
VLLSCARLWLCRSCVRAAADGGRWADMRRIVVIEYDPAWPATFDDLRARVWPVVGDHALAIEHMGSTSVPGLAATPIIDMTVVLPSADDVPQAIERLATLGYGVCEVLWCSSGMTTLGGMRILWKSIALRLPSSVVPLKH